MDIKVMLLQCLTGSLAGCGVFVEREGSLHQDSGRDWRGPE